MCALILLLAPASVLAQARVASSVSVYGDDDATEVLTAVTSGSAAAWSGGTLTATYLIDVISSASVDVVTQATPGFEEYRHGVTASVAQTVGDHVVRASYGFSIEVGRGDREQRPDERVEDYLGHGVGLGGDLVLFDRNTTLSADYALELGTVGRADDAVFSEGLTTHSADLRVAQILSKSVIGTLGWTLTLQDGYTAKPYRFARVGEVSPGVCRSCPPETHPGSRLRNALFASAKKHLFDETAAELTYRFYFDDWAMLAHTAEAQLHLGWTPAWGTRLRYRLHMQNGVSFWEDVYDQPRRYMTADRELSPLTGHLVGALVFGRLGRVSAPTLLGAYAKVDLFRYDYSDYAALDSRSGAVVEAGVEVEF